jgi:hypothetical protein
MPGMPSTSRKTVSYCLPSIAKLGGCLAHKGDPPPGNMVMWRGITRLADIVLGMSVAKETWVIKRLKERLRSIHTNHHANRLTLQPLTSSIQLVRRQAGQYGPEEIVCTRSITHAFRDWSLANAHVSLAGPPQSEGDQGGAKCNTHH